MNIWFTSDLHLGHTNIIKYCNRPFDNIQEHDEYIINNINKYVKKDDILYILGDFLFTRDSYALKLNSILEKINTNEIIWILGNHDPNRYQVYDILSILNNTLKEKSFARKVKKVDNFLESNLHNLKFIFTHYAFLVWNKSHRNSINLYGHSHSTLEPFFDKICPQRRSMDVGIDNAKLILGDYRPFSIDDIKHIMKDRDGSVIDHHKIKIDQPNDIISEFLNNGGEKI